MIFIFLLGQILALSQQKLTKGKGNFKDLLIPRVLIATKDNAIIAQNPISGGKMKILQGEHYRDIDTGLTKSELSNKKTKFLGLRFNSNPFVNDYRDVIRRKKVKIRFYSDSQGRKTPILPEDKQEALKYKAYRKNIQGNSIVSPFPEERLIREEFK